MRRQVLGRANLHVTENHFSNDVETRLLVGDGLDHANRNKQNNTNKDTDNIRPPWQVSRPDLGGNHAESKAHSEDNREPPLRSLLVLAHKLQVDIGLLRARAKSTAPNIGAIEETAVEDGGHEGGKGHAVGQRKRGS